MAVFNIFRARRRHPIYDMPIAPVQTNNTIETYRNGDFKIRKVEIDENSETIMLEYSFEGEIKHTQITFMVLQKLIEGKLN